MAEVSDAPALLAKMERDGLPTRQDHSITENNVSSHGDEAREPGARLSTMRMRVRRRRCIPPVGLESGDISAQLPVN